jgi:hypothetical protein
MRQRTFWKDAGVDLGSMAQKEMLVMGSGQEKLPGEGET